MDDNEALIERLRQAAAEPAEPGKAFAIPVGLGVGKTREALEQIRDATGEAPEFKVAYAAPTHRLLADIRARLTTLAPTVRSAVWYGEAAEVPADPSRGRAAGPACPRHEERAQLRRSGIASGGALCGSRERGFCPYHEEGRGPRRCHYRAQRQAVREADVVLLAFTMLSDRAPTWMRNALPAQVPVIDPATGEPVPGRFVRREDIDAADLPPDVDLLVIDEPLWLALVRGHEEPFTEITAADLDWLKARIATRTCPAPPPESDPDRLSPWPKARPPSDEEPEEDDDDAPDHVQRARALLEQIRQMPPPTPEAMAEKARERAEAEAAVIAALPGMRAAQARVLQAFAGPLVAARPGFLTYGAIAAALTAARQSRTPAPYDDRDLAKMLELIAWKLLVRPPVDPGKDQVEELAKAGIAKTVRWNRLLLALRRAAAAVGAARRRKQGAAATDVSGLLRAVEGGPAGRRVQVRWVEPIHPQWRKGTVLVLDATHRAEVAERFLPGIEAMKALDPGPARGSCHVRQVWDQSFSHTEIGKQLAGGHGDRFLRRLAVWAEVGHALARWKNEAAAGMPSGLLVVPLFLEEALTGWWARSPLGRVPEGLEIAHFNALRGIDRWREVLWLGVVGRTLPAADDLRDLASIIDGMPADTEEEYIRQEAEWLDASDPGRSWTRPDLRLAREDGLEQTQLEMITDDDRLQAIGRARLVQRPGAGVAVDILGSHPVPGVEVDELVTFEEIEAGLDAAALAAARGVVVEIGAKGCWEVLAAVAGGSAKSVRDEFGEAEEEEDPEAPAESDLIALKCGSPFKESPIEGDPHLRAIYPDSPVPPETASSPWARAAVSELVERLLKLGVWTGWRLHQPGKRYAVPIRVRAATQEAAEALLRPFFPEGILEPVDPPKRPRGRPPRGG